MSTSLGYLPTNGPAGQLRLDVLNKGSAPHGFKKVMQRNEKETYTIFGKVPLEMVKAKSLRKALREIR